MEKIIYDIECLENCFIVNLKNIDTKQKLTLEISERRNDALEFPKIFNNNNKIFFGYNCIDYDGILVAYVLTNISKEPKELTKELKVISDKVINEKVNYFKLKYHKYFYQIDLLRLLFSKELRVSLKELQVSMFYPNVLEMDVDWDKPIPVEDIDRLIHYCWNDVDSTEQVYLRCVKDLELRKEIESVWGIDCYSQDGMTLGVNILAKEYCDATGLTVADLKELGTPRGEMFLKDIILPWISYDTPELQDFLNMLKGKSIVNTKGDLAFEVEFDDMVYGIGTGGIHSRNKPTIYETNDEYDLEDADVDLTQWVN